MRTAFKELLGIILVTLLLFGLIEISTRLLAPQTVVTEYIEGGPLGLEDTILGHVNRPNVQARVRAPEYDVSYVVDSRGFRSDTLSPPEEKSGPTKRVLLIGDSFTFGAANQYEDIWPVKLSSMLEDSGADVQLINAGVPGYDTSQQALYLERLYDEVRPDLVVVMFLPNDMFANEPIEELDGVEVARGDADAIIKAGVSKKSSLQSVVLVKRMLMKNDALYTKLYKMTPRREFFEQPPTEIVSRKVETTVSLFQRIKSFCDDKGSDVMVVSVPQLFQVLEVSSNGDEADGVDAFAIDTELSTTLALDGINWVSTLDGLAKSYAANGIDLYHRHDGHINAAGNEVVAGQVYEALLPLLKD